MNKRTVGLVALESFITRGEKKESPISRFDNRSGFRKRVVE